MKKFVLILVLAFFANAADIADAKNSVKASVNSAENRVVPGISDDESTITLFVKKDANQTKNLVKSEQNSSIVKDVNVSCDCKPIITENNSTILFFKTDLNATCSQECK